MSRKVLRPSGFEMSDAAAFAAEVEDHPFFEPSLDIVIARAPGRLDLMGGIADYSGSLVLQWPLREATLVAAQKTGDGRLAARSLGDGEKGNARMCDLPVDDLFPGGRPLDLESARRYFKERTGETWSAYVLGVLVVLAHEKGALNPAGLRLLIRSSVPEGKGVSSSAAVEVAVMQAIVSLLDLSLGPRDLALLAQTVENRIVGAACGVMDQMTASCGEGNRLLALLCQPAELLGTIALPPDLEVWGIDSGVRHAVSGSDYTSVRIGAFMGARILAERAGLPARGTEPGMVEIEDERWRGYLANVTPSELEGGTLGPLPVTMAGAEFLATYGGTTDPVTRVDPSRAYAVRACAAHPVYENLRVRAFWELLEASSGERRNEQLGELMYQSHASYTACGLGAEATDLLVDLVRGAGSGRGFFGAKITGGGSGGTVAVLGRRGAPIQEIAQACAARTGHRPRVFSGSSSGSAAFGSIRLGPAR